jgi:hypothetical protein
MSSHPIGDRQQQSSLFRAMRARTGGPETAGDETQRVADFGDQEVIMVGSVPQSLVGSRSARDGWLS